MLAAPGLLALLAGQRAQGGGAAESGERHSEKDIQAFTVKYCYECHGDGAHKANVALDKYQSLADVQKTPKRGSWCSRKSTGMRCRPTTPTPSPPSRNAMWLPTGLTAPSTNTTRPTPDPGHITLHPPQPRRVREHDSGPDGVDYRASDDFPPDDSGYGFDNIGDVLSLPPMLMEKYLSAADTILDRAIPTDPHCTRKQTFPGVPARQRLQ